MKIIFSRKSPHKESYLRVFNQIQMNNVIEIPLKEGSSQVVRFTDSEITYEGTSIAYIDVAGIKLYSWMNSTTATSSKHNVIQIRAQNGKCIAIKTGGFKVFLIGSSFDTNYRQIADCILQRAGPCLLEKIVRQILTPGNSFRIGSLVFDSKGIAFERSFGAPRFVAWEYRPDVRSTTKWSWLSSGNTTGVLEVSYFYPPSGKLIVVGTTSSQDENGIFVPHICQTINSILHTR
ncbi:MAG TPA: hypothetical protein VK737_10800 [Opitutales bacterium]|jgi:hypothetical protein|nr:hypothetical protein [Opitutales bacterium]